MNHLMIIVLLLIAPVTAFAEEWFSLGRGKDLRTGMNYKDVIKVMGAPAEKTEREALREDLWTYSDSFVVFKEGKVFEARLNTEKAGVGRKQERDEDLSDLYDTVGEDESRLDTVEVEEILTEIMNGSSPEGKDSRDDRRRKRGKRR